MSKVLSIICISMWIAMNMSCINEKALKAAIQEALDEADIEIDDDGYRDSKKWGEVTEIDIAATDFTKIMADGNIDVVYTQGDDYETILHGNKNVFDYYDIKSDNGTLTIAAARNHRGSLPTLTLYVTAPTLEKVEMNGTGDVDMKEPVSFDQFEVVSNGTGDLDIRDITCTGDFNIYIYGTGDADIRSASCVNSVFTITGTGDIKAGNLKANGISAICGGTGDIELKVDCKKITAKANGTGEIEIEGRAHTFVREASGLGKIDSKKLNADEIIRTE